MLQNTFFSVGKKKKVIDFPDTFVEDTMDSEYWMSSLYTKLTVVSSRRTALASRLEIIAVMLEAENRNLG